MNNILPILFLCVIILSASVGIPLAVIWACNTIFGLNIELNFWTWLAALILLTFLSNLFRRES